MAEKLDPIVGQLCFRRIFQTVRNLKKRTTGMSSEGLKMGGREVWVCLKWPEKCRKPVTHHGGGRRVRRPDLGAFGGGWP